jgi:transcriptional regulator with XRE-family HTH domain
MAQSKWPQVEDKLLLIEKWARDGLTELQIAKNLGISKTTLEQYKKNYPHLKNTLKKGKEIIITELENALIKKALGYEYEEKKVYTKTEDGVTTTYTEITKKHQPPDTGALFGLLKNKDPEHYSDNPQMLELKRQELELRKKLAETNGDW